MHKVARDTSFSMCGMPWFLEKCKDYTALHLQNSSWMSASCLGCFCHSWTKMLAVRSAACKELAHGEV